MGCDGRKNVRVHRISYMLDRGVLLEEVPDVVRHTCHRTLCVNPVHLEGGTQYDNIQDQIERGTHVSQVVENGNRATGWRPRGKDVARRKRRVA